MIKVHHLRPSPGSHTAKKRVGRGDGSGKGKTAGRGTKGTKARANVPAYFEGQLSLYRRLPKLKGFRNPFTTTYQVVNVGRLGELFPDGGPVGPDELVKAGAVRAGQPVKVLGEGELGVALQVSAHAFSASARTKIGEAGGTATEL